MTRVRVSIIIPHYRGWDILEECLGSLDQTIPGDTEIILVDNAGGDDSIQRAQQSFPQIHVVEPGKNLGYAGGCNFGARHASGDYLLFLNNDTIHTERWLEPLLAALEKDPGIASAQPKILNYRQRHMFDYAGGAGGYLDVLGFPFVAGRLFQHVEEDHGQYDSPEPQTIFWASGTAFITRTELFNKVGGFDQTFFAHMEEIDYHWRTQLMGYRNVVVTDSVVHHHSGATLPMDSVQKKYLNHRNGLLMIFTNFNRPLTAYLILPRLSLEIIASVYAAVLLDWGHVVAIWRALGWICTHPGSIWRRRKQTRALRQLSDGEILLRFYRSSVIFDHYIRRKKTFQELGKGRIIK